MKKIFFISILLFFSVCLYAQIDSETNPDGYQRFYYENGQLSSEGYMENGRPNGYWKNYYPNGKIRSEGKRTNFELDSIWCFYDEEGFLSKKIQYKSGLKHGHSILYQNNKIEDSTVQIMISKELYYEDSKNGISEYYYPETGNLKLSIPFVSDKRHGLAKEYTQSGEIHRILEYYNGFLTESSMVNRKNSEGKKTGKWVDFHPAGQLKTVAYYQNGKLHGTYTEFSKSGEIMKEEQYRNGEILIATEEAAKIKAKLSQTYHSNGKLAYEGAFIDSIPIGLHKIYNENGKLEVAKEFNEIGQITAQGKLSQEGEKDSLWTFYFPDGNIRSKGAFINGKRDGSWQFFFENGNIEQSGEYQLGKPEGEWIWYYPNGKVLRKENYRKGKREGMYYEFKENGDTIQYGEFFDDVQNGKWYLHVGDHTEIGSYELGLKQGEWTHYYNGETIIFRGNYIDNEPDGTHEWFYTNGQPEEIGKYIMGIKDGKWYKYHRDGSIFLIIEYKTVDLYKINGKRWDKVDKMIEKNNK
jgi:uncharacterized protein